MTELSFSKQFLANLASRPVKLTGEYVQDPRNIRAVYTLPKTLPPMKKRAVDASGKTPTASVTVKPLRPTPALTPLSLPDTPLSTSILTIKAKYSTATAHAPEKLRVLLKGKPVADVKTLQDLGLKDGEELVLTVMAMGGGAGGSSGGAASPAAPWPAASPPPPPPPTDEGEKVSVLETDAFWDELGGFLDQRLGQDQVVEEPEHVLRVFREAWRK